MAGHPVFTILLAVFISGTAWSQNIPDLESRLRQATTAQEKLEISAQLARAEGANNPKQAAVYAEQALRLAVQLKDQQQETEIAWLAADLAERGGRLPDAIRLYEQAKTAASAAEMTSYPLQATEKLYTLCAKLGDYPAAYRWQQAHAILLEQQYRKQTMDLNRQHVEELAARSNQKDYETRVLLAALSGLALLAVFFYYSRQRAHRRIRGEMAEKNAMIEEKRRRSEQLLLNILPQAVAAELTVRNRVAARRYERTTVMFIDFVRFTQVAEQLTPEELVAELDQCFSAFDEMIGRKRIEKIKTVGDAYICASGLSDRNESPADIIRAALQIQVFLKKRLASRQAEGKTAFEARIGIHFGPVVAGVVGTKKFAYDLWGDTVNTAARMEEACEAGFINVSGAARAIIVEEFQWDYRGKIAAKNKGELEMYYVSAR